MSDKKSDKSDAIEEYRPGTKIGIYKIVKTLGSGSYGRLFLVELENGRQFAMKITTLNAKVKLEFEYGLVKTWHQAAKCFPDLVKESAILPRCYLYGEWNNGKECVFVMDLLYDNLSEFMHRYHGGDFGAVLGIFNNRGLPWQFVQTIGIRLIRALEIFHSIGYVHCDLKPENIMLYDEKNQDPGKIALIDFGLARKYLVKRTQHIKNEPKLHSHHGTVRYMSINTHHLDQPSRRDDMESLIYVLAYLLYGELEWQKLDRDNKDVRIQQVGEMKKDFERYCKQPELIQAWRYCRKLEFAEQPDYNRLIKFL